MSAHDHSPHESAPPSVVRKSHRSYWVFGGFAALAIMALAFEHRMHLSGLFGWLPYLILLACPLMHLFMHGDHGHGRHDGKSDGGSGK